MEINLMPKNAEFFCYFCDFKCSKRSNYEIHVKTTKHLHRLNGNKMEIMEMKKNATHICKFGLKHDCGTIAS